MRVERRPVLLAALEEEELGLRPDRHLVALGLGVGEHLLELHARVAGERRAVGIGDVADDARRAARLALAPGQHLERRGIGMEVHVGLLDALEPADRGAVEHQLVVEGLLELRGGDRDVLQLAVQLGELQAHELDVVLATALDQLALVHLVSSSRREYGDGSLSHCRPACTSPHRDTARVSIAARLCRVYFTSPDDGNGSATVTTRSTRNVPSSTVSTARRRGVMPPAGVAAQRPSSASCAGSAASALASAARERARGRPPPRARRARLGRVDRDRRRLAVQVGVGAGEAARAAAELLGGDEPRDHADALGRRSRPVEEGERVEGLRRDDGGALRLRQQRERAQEVGRPGAGRPGQRHELDARGLQLVHQHRAAASRTRRARRPDRRRAAAPRPRARSRTRSPRRCARLTIATRVASSASASCAAAAP